MSSVELDGQVAIITGAGRGLGRTHALELARRGARVVVNDLRPRDDEPWPAAAVVEEIEASGGAAIADDHSVADADGAAALVGVAVDAFGRIDTVVNNAGVLRDRSFAKLTRDDLETVLDVHLHGTFWVTHAAWSHLEAADQGCVVNTTSVAGYLGNFGQANYGAAKAGIIGLTNVLAIEGQRRGIRVNAIAPGARTRMTEDLLGDLADHLDPSLVSPFVAWLVHPACDATGSVFVVQGGRISEVLVGQTQGIFDPSLTAETVRDRWDELRDRADLVFPATVTDELQLLLRHLEQAG